MPHHWCDYYLPSSPHTESTSQAEQALGRSLRSLARAAGRRIRQPRCVHIWMSLRYLLIDETIQFNLSIQISNPHCSPTRHSTQCPLQSPKCTYGRVICSYDRQITRCDVPQKSQIATPDEYRVGTVIDYSTGLTIQMP